MCCRHGLHLVARFYDYPVRSASPIVLVHNARDSCGIDRDEPYCRFSAAFQSILAYWSEFEAEASMPSTSLPLLYLEGHKS